MISKLATQVKASKLTDYQLTNKLLEQGEVQKLQLLLDVLIYGINKDDKENKGSGGSGGRGGMMERQVLVHHHQELHNKKWKILLEN